MTAPAERTDGIAAITGIVIGGPGVLGSWAYRVIAEAAARAEPSARHVWVDRNDAIPASEQLASPGRVLFSQFPSRELIAMIAAADVPVLVIVEDPIDMVLHQRRLHKVSSLEALRGVSASFIAGPALRDHPRVAYLHRAMAEPISDVVAEISRHLGIVAASGAHEALVALASCPADPQGAWTIETTLAGLEPHYAAAQRATLTVAPDELSPAQCTLISSVIDPLANLSINAPPQPIIWPPAVFLSGDRPIFRCLM